MRHIVPLAFIALGLLPRLAAQQPLLVLPGQHIRVTSATDSVVHLPVQRVARLEIARPKRKRPIIIGAAVGAVAGAIAGLSIAGTKCLRSSYLDPCDSTSELLAPVAGAVVGATVVGGFVALVQTRWMRVGIEVR